MAAHPPPCRTTRANAQRRPEAPQRAFYRGRSVELEGIGNGQNKKDNLQVVYKCFYCMYICIEYGYSFSPPQEKVFIWPPFFQYNKRLLRQKTGGACLYMPQDGHWLLDSQF